MPTQTRPRQPHVLGRSRRGTLNRFDLYELCVTEPQRLARFIAAAHGRTPKILREDFSGTGALCRAWPQAVSGGRAIAVDLDAQALARAKSAGVRTLRADVRRARVKADVIAATNFPLGYWHTRRELLAYLRLTRFRLRPHGIFVADTYGGSDAWRTRRVTRRLRGPRGERVVYTWEQRRADPFTARVLDVLSFRVTVSGRTRAFPDAFVYDWRLWNVPELRDAMLEAGFRSVEVHDRLGDAIDDRGVLHVRPVGPDEPIDDPFVAYLVARA